MTGIGVSGCYTSTTITPRGEGIQGTKTEGNVIFQGWWFLGRLAEEYNSALPVGDIR